MSGPARRVLALRHVGFEDLGLLAPALQARGFARIDYWDAGAAPLLDADCDAADLLVVLGGPMAAEDEAGHPFLTEELRQIRRRLAAQRPLLGICLGAQLMARALGAAVRPMAHGQLEIGFAPLELSAAGLRSPLAALPPGLPVLHWHGDQFELPAGLPSLAGSALCPHQAFMPGPQALALQFHLEANPACIEHWISGHAAELRRAGVDPQRLRADAARHGPALAQGLAALLDAWLPGCRAGSDRRE